MLQRQTVSSQLLGLLERLMAIQEFGDLRLVGGTALALQIGHRNSVDIDLFGRHELNELMMSHTLRRFEQSQKLGGSQSITPTISENTQHAKYPRHTLVFTPEADRLTFHA